MTGATPRPSAPSVPFGMLCPRAQERAALDLSSELLEHAFAQACAPLLLAAFPRSLYHAALDRTPEGRAFVALSGSFDVRELCALARVAPVRAQCRFSVAAMPKGCRALWAGERRRLAAFLTAQQGASSAKEAARMACAIAKSVDALCDRLAAHASEMALHFEEPEAHEGRLYLPSGAFWGYDFAAA